MTSHTPTPQNTINVSGSWSAGHYQRTTGYTYVFYWQGSSNNDSVPRSILYNNTTRKWEDNGAGVPTSFDGNNATTTSANPQNVTGYSSNTAVWSFTNPYYDSTWSAGPTVTQTRTTHTGIIPASADFTIRTPSPGPFYEKTGVGKFKIKFLDQNEPGTYLLQVHWTTLTGTISDTQTIASGSGDIELEYEGTSPSNTPVYGPITVQIDNYTITNNGIQYSPGTVFKTFTYLETGPFTASFSPASGATGETIGYTVTDTNPYPDNNSAFSIDHPSFTNVANGTLSLAVPTASNNAAFTSVEGTYTLTVNNSVIAQANYGATTSDGGGKRRRYPIISTNLFDRQKSIFSIGLTHKDETLF